MRLAGSWRAKHKQAKSTKFLYGHSLKTLNIIGAGRVGRSLAQLWHNAGVFAIQDVLTRSQASADEAVQFIGAGRAVTNLSDMRTADVWMLAVPDGQINRVAMELANMHLASVFIANAAIVFHCSGALSSAELQALRGAGDQDPHLASAHCILSFSAPASAVSQFAGTPCALEGDVLATQTLQPAFEAISAKCFDIAEKDKILYHAAAVFATNFLPVLQVVAADLWRGSGMPEPMIAPLSVSLLQKSVQNIASQGAAKALTGPAARGDTALVALQGKAVADWNSQAGLAYAALSQLASQIAKHGTIEKIQRMTKENTP
jgi:predicted short-subunit dehydrogenase-like oxidoreductase (DUF2520 family)